MTGRRDWPNGGCNLSRLEPRRAPWLAVGVRAVSQTVDLFVVCAAWSAAWQCC